MVFSMLKLKDIFARQLTGQHILQLMMLTVSHRYESLWDSLLQRENKNKRALPNLKGFTILFRTKSLQSLSSFYLQEKQTQVFLE